MTDDMLALARRNSSRGRRHERHLPQGPHRSGATAGRRRRRRHLQLRHQLLSPDKDAVLAEAFRVLRPRGRFAVADIVLLRDIPDALRGIVALWTGCISGALRDTEYVAKLDAAGFADTGVQVTRRYERTELEELTDSQTRRNYPLV